MKIYLAFINNHLPPGWQSLSSDLQQFMPYHFELIYPKIDMKNFFSRERNQYHSTLILAEILLRLPEDGDKILGITNVDIFIPILTFLFGEAQLNGAGSLISTFRLRNEYYGLPQDDRLHYQRILKEALHELGHTLGLKHCLNYECTMHSSTYVEDIDLKKSWFCGVCRNFLNFKTI